jgi:serine/threonine kinase PknH
VDVVAFGRYRLLSVIGEGGMGKVYKAHDTVIGRDVALKVLSTELGAEPGYQQRFRREAHVAARLTEPHIIPIHDTGEIDGRLYLVMPVIEGTDVHGLLQRHGPMSPQRAVLVIEQLAAALDAAHAVGLVHRDVKPSNALVTGRDFVYLIDFGIAHDTAATKLTRTGTIVGSWAYMAPERFTSGSADARVDIYALACVLYECLAGVQPYPGDSLEQQFTGHFSLDPPKPSTSNPAIPAGFDEVIARGMAKDPDQRYQSASDLAAAAHHALTSRPAPGSTHIDPTESTYRPTLLHNQPRPVPAPGPVWQQPAHLNLADISQSAPGWGAIPQPGAADWQAPPIGAPPTPWGQRPRRGLKWPLIAGIVVVLAAAGITTGYLLRPDSSASKTATAQPAMPSGRSAQPAPPSEPTSGTPEPGTRGAPVAPTALAGLLLSPEQISTAMGSPGMTAGASYTAMGDDSATVSDKACLPLYSPVQDPVYAGSGWTAMRGQQIVENQTPTALKRFVLQNAVLFPNAHAAGAFFTASAQSWSACSNRPFNVTLSGKPPQVYTVGPISNTDGTLSATSSGGATCQRALTVANNVAIDVVGCSVGQSDFTVDPVVNIAHQIAAKVPAT